MYDIMTESEQYAELKETVNARLAGIAVDAEPRSLYEPTAYVLRAGGKRVRAVLVILAAQAVGGRASDAVDAGVAVEILHNFTLVHDDIMDRATTRRGRATVHTRWDEGTAILVGDVMIGIAHQVLLAKEPPQSVRVMRSFTRGVIDVCEGQSLDREFEARRRVSIDEYLHMISMKTGRLVEMAAEIGGIVGGGSVDEIDALVLFARNIGLAFQIQDDLLDIVADQAEFGKQIGGDIIEGKKTYLFVRADAMAALDEDRSLLEEFVSKRGLPLERVVEIRALYERLGVLAEARAQVRDRVQAAITHLARLKPSPARQMLAWFAEMLMNRTT